MDWLGRAVEGDCAGHEVAYSTGLERARGLKVVEFQIDVAWLVSRSYNGNRGRNYQPACRERAVDRMQGVLIQGFEIGGAFEPIVVC